MTICSYNQSNTNACARRICGPTPICYCQMTPVSPNWQVRVEGCSYPTLIRRTKEAKQNFVWNIKIINLFLPVSPPPSRQVYLKQDNKKTETMLWRCYALIYIFTQFCRPVSCLSWCNPSVWSLLCFSLSLYAFSKSCEIAFSLVPFWFWVVKLF